MGRVRSSCIVNIVRSLVTALCPASHEDQDLVPDKSVVVLSASCCEVDRVFVKGVDSSCLKLHCAGQAVR